MAQEAQVDWDLRALQEIFSAALDEGLLKRRPDVRMRVDGSPTVEITYIKSKVFIWYDRTHDIYLAAAEPLLERDGADGSCPMRFRVNGYGNTAREAIEGLRRKVRELAREVEAISGWVKDALDVEGSIAADAARDAIDATLASIHDLMDALGIKKEG